MEDLLQQHESQVARQTQSANPTAIELCHAASALFIKGFDTLGPVTAEPVRIEIIQLLAMAFNALRWSREQVIKGYYSPAVTMARTAFECWLTGAYLVLYPEELENWKQFETRPLPRRCGGWSLSVQALTTKPKWTLSGNRRTSSTGAEKVSRSAACQSYLTPLGRRFEA
jgi:hypothetical protein